jgi:cytochrome c biogenesis protein CcdA
VVLVALLFGLTAVIWTAQRETLRRMQARVGDVKRWAGYVLLAVGIWLIATAIFAQQLTSVFRV